MSLIVCPKCGEETLDRLSNCPVCNEPLKEGINRNETREKRRYFWGAAFVGGLVLATVFNILGFTNVAIVFGVLGILSLIAFILKLNATN